MSEQLDYTISEEPTSSRGQPPANNLQTTRDTSRGPPAAFSSRCPPQAHRYPDGSMDLPRGSFQQPPRGYTYRTYPSPPDHQPYDSCRFSTEVKMTRTFFARVQDSTKRTWVSYHLAFPGLLLNGAGSGSWHHPSCTLLVTKCRTSPSASRTSPGSNTQAPTPGRIL